MNELSSDIIFGDLFLKKIRAVLDFSERTIKIQNLTKESMIFPLSDNEARTKLSTLITQPEKLGELKTFQQVVSKMKPIDNLSSMRFYLRSEILLRVNLSKWSTLMCIVNSTRGQM